MIRVHQCIRRTKQGDEIIGYEFSDEISLVNPNAVSRIEPRSYGSDIVFPDREVWQVKETVTEINMQVFAERMQGHE